MKVARLVVPGVLVAAQVTRSGAFQGAMASRPGPSGGRGAAAVAPSTEAFAPVDSKKPGTLHNLRTAVEIGVRQGISESLGDLQTPRDVGRRLVRQALHEAGVAAFNRLLTFLTARQWDIDIPSSNKPSRPLALPGGVEGKIGSKGGTISLHRGTPGPSGTPSHVVLPPAVTVPDFSLDRGSLYQLASKVADLEPRKVTLDRSRPGGAILERSFLRFPWGGKVEVPKPMELPPITWQQLAQDLARTAVDLAKAGASVHSV